MPWAGRSLKGRLFEAARGAPWLEGRLVGVRFSGVVGRGRRRKPSLPVRALWVLIAAGLLACGCGEDRLSRMGLTALWRAIERPFQPVPLGQMEAELAADPPRFSFVVLGNTDLSSGGLTGEGEATRFDRIMAVVRSMKPEPRFVFHVGELADSPGDTGAWDALVRKARPFEAGPDPGAAAGATGRRLFLLPGERDVNSLKTEKAFLERFRRSSGRVPFSFDWENVHFVALDSETVDDSWLMKYFGYNRKQNRITGAQWAWLREDLRKNRGKPIVVFIHKPFFPPVFSAHEGYCLDQYYFARERLIDLLREYSVKVVFSGHEPIFTWVRVEGTYYVITGGAGGKPGAPARFGGFPHFLYVTVGRDGGMTVYCVNPEKNAVEQKIEVMQAQ